MIYKHALEDFVGFSLEKKVPVGCVAPRFSEEDRCSPINPDFHGAALCQRYRASGSERSGGSPLEVKWTQIDTDSYIYIKGTWKIRSI